MPIRVLHVGLGPIGLGVVRQVASRKGLTAVAAVDLDPGKVGRDLGDIAEIGRRLRLKVQDSGAGIAAEELPFVFERFYRGDRSRSDSGESGLGLAIARSIVEAHGGRITVESTPGAGTTFTMTIPDKT